MSNVIKCPQSKWFKHFFHKEYKNKLFLSTFYIKKTKINKKKQQQLKYLKYYYVHCPQVFNFFSLKYVLKNHHK